MGGGVWNYSRTFSLTSALAGVVGQSHASAALPPAKVTPYRYRYRTLAWPRGRSRWVRKLWPPRDFDSRTVKTVASRYTDCAIAAAIDYVLNHSMTTKTMPPI